MVLCVEEKFWGRDATAKRIYVVSQTTRRALPAKSSRQESRSAQSTRIHSSLEAGFFSALLCSVFCHDADCSGAYVSSVGDVKISASLCFDPPSSVHSHLPP